MSEHVENLEKRIKELEAESWRTALDDSAIHYCLSDKDAINHFHKKRQERGSVTLQHRETGAPATISARGYVCINAGLVSLDLRTTYEWSKWQMTVDLKSETTAVLNRLINEGEALVQVRNLKCMMCDSLNREMVIKQLEKERGELQEKLETQSRAWHQAAAEAKPIIESRLKRHVVCLCGSTHFHEEFVAANLRETLKGNIVLTIGAATASDSEHIRTGAIIQEDKTKLDALHFDKIAMADEILVLNVDGYIGESTHNEINHAVKLGKTVRYWCETDAHAARVDVSYDVDLKEYVATRDVGTELEAKGSARTSWEAVEAAYKNWLNTRRYTKGTQTGRVSSSQPNASSVIGVVVGADATAESQWTPPKDAKVTAGYDIAPDEHLQRAEKMATIAKGAAMGDQQVATGNALISIVNYLKSKL